LKSKARRRHAFDEVSAFNRRLARFSTWARVAYSDEADNLSNMSVPPAL
jgi:hypothetical protein